MREYTLRVYDILCCLAHLYNDEDPTIDVDVVIDIDIYGMAYLYLNTRQFAAKINMSYDMLEKDPNDVAKDILDSFLKKAEEQNGEIRSDVIHTSTTALSHQ